MERGKRKKLEVGGEENLIDNNSSFRHDEFLFFFFREGSPTTKKTGGWPLLDLGRLKKRHNIGW